MGKAVTYRFFLAGIIQGSKRDLGVHDQEYRDQIRLILEDGFPGSDVYCPVENHPDSVHYDEAKAQKVFLEHVEKVRESHALVVYLPEASMGSAIEMWEAYHAKAVTVAISPMTTNWVVRILSDEVCGDIEDFRRLIESDKLGRLLRERF